MQSEPARFPLLNCANCYIERNGCTGVKLLHTSHVHTHTNTHTQLQASPQSVEKDMSGLWTLWISLVCLLNTTFPLIFSLYISSEFYFSTFEATV